VTFRLELGVGERILFCIDFVLGRYSVRLWTIRLAFNYKRSFNDGQNEK
jgi:hypothetical protein